MGGNVIPNRRCSYYSFDAALATVTLNLPDPPQHDVRRLPRSSSTPSHRGLRFRVQSSSSVAPGARCAPDTNFVGGFHHGDEQTPQRRRMGSRMDFLGSSGLRPHAAFHEHVARPKPYHVGCNGWCVRRRRDLALRADNRYRLRRHPDRHAVLPGCWSATCPACGSNRLGLARPRITR